MDAVFSWIGKQAASVAQTGEKLASQLTNEGLYPEATARWKNFQPSLDPIARMVTLIALSVIVTNLSHLYFRGPGILGIAGLYVSTEALIIRDPVKKFLKSSLAIPLFFNAEELSYLDQLQAQNESWNYLQIEVKKVSLTYKIYRALTGP